MPPLNLDLNRRDYRGERGIFGQNSSLPNLSEFLLSKTYLINFEIQPFDSHFFYVFKSFFEM